MHSNGTLSHKKGCVGKLTNLLHYEVQTKLIPDFFIYILAYYIDEFKTF